MRRMWMLAFLKVGSVMQLFLFVVGCPIGDEVVEEYE